MVSFTITLVIKSSSVGLRLEDVLAYKERIDEQRLDALDQLTGVSQDEGMGY